MKNLNSIHSDSFLSLIVLGSVCMTFSSCRHKDIDFEDVPMQEVNIVFDWSKAPEANPESMMVWLFYNPEESADSTLRYDFNNSYGGPVKIPYGSFSGLAVNSDNSDWAHFRNTEDIETFEIYTREITSLPASGMKTRALPRAREAEEENMVETPKGIWSARNDNMVLKREENKKTFTYYPEELTCHYTVDIYDVTNIASIDGTAIDATLSGMAGGYYHGRNEPTDTRLTLPFIMTKRSSENALHGEFLTFGESPKTKNPHKLGLYVVMSDGNKYFYNFDVGTQIYDAPDPKNVHIIIHGLSLPEPVTGEGGFAPDVNEWESVNIDLRM